MSLNVERRDDICELRLSAPPGNVIDREMCETMAAAIREQAADRHLKAFLFRADGKHFSYGASVPQHVAGEVEKFLPAFHGVFTALVEAGVPTIAAVQGLCLGGAFELVAFCNLVVAEETAAFAVPEVTLGVMPPAACVILPFKLDGAVAEDLILTGRKIGAAECELVSRLCKPGELDAAVDALLNEQIRPLSAAALRMNVKAACQPLHEAVRERLFKVERLYLDELMATRDANEGIRAFLEKRKPVWEDA